MTRVEELIKDLTDEVEKRKARLDNDLDKKTQMLFWFETNAPTLLSDFDAIRVNSDIHIGLPMEISVLRKARKLLGAKWRFSFSWYVNGKYTVDGHNGFACSYFYTGKAPFVAFIHFVMKDTTRADASHRIIQKACGNQPVFDLIPA